MPRFGKSDATGRSSGKLGGREGKLRRPPQGESWAWLTAELMASESWRSRSINARRLMDFLLIEHCNHAGRENGRLKATHTQLRAFGLTAEAIRFAIEECEKLGLIAFARGGRWAGTNQPSLFRLTFYADAEGAPPSNEWKAASVRIEAARTQKAASETRRTVPRKPGVPSPNLRIA